MMFDRAWQFAGWLAGTGYARFAALGLVALAAAWWCRRKFSRIKAGARQFFVWLISARYFWLAALYVGLVAATWWHWPASSANRDYRATGELWFNHRIAAGDFRRPDGGAWAMGFYTRPTASVLGRYVAAKCIPADQPIKAAELADHPDTTLPDQQTVAVVFASADPQSIALLDAGAGVVLFGQDDAKAPVAISATVRTMLCDDGATDAKSCRPVLFVSKTDAPVVLKNLASLKLAPVASARPQPCQ